MLLKKELTYVIYGHLHCVDKPNFSNQLRIATAVVSVKSSSEQVVGVTAADCELRTDWIPIAAICFKF
jgi:hypothetical protein